MTAEQVRLWLAAHPLLPIQIDCAVTVMLKILDGKCKMPPTEKMVMTLLYDQIKTREGELFGAELNALIDQARERSDDEQLKMHIYEKRLLAETAISRPVMKKFKAFIREEGLLDSKQASEEDA
jgi:hypothetical protein